jgi:hypothetical protein
MPPPLLGRICTGEEEDHIRTGEPCRPAKHEFLNQSFLVLVCENFFNNPQSHLSRNIKIQLKEFNQRTR